MRISEKVARAIVGKSRLSGCLIDGFFDDTEEERVQNLLRNGKYGAYIIDGDPYDWGGSNAVATIFMEQHGGDGDCFIPLDYYGEDGEDGFTVASKASEVLGEYWIDFINPAVACVYKD